jgi:very-short-patch-repair endonuclease
MATRYRKPRMRIVGTSRVAGGVVGEVAPSALAKPNHGPRRTQRHALKRKKSYTPAEKRLESILNSLGSGALRGKFHREWVFSRWIVDFFFWEIRLGIEVDGLYHGKPRQAQRDVLKTLDLEGADITVLRLTNTEVFGDRERLVSKLRVAYGRAKQRTRLAATKPVVAVDRAK